MEQARKDILDAFGGVPPKVLDPFGGGGSIPLEALRLGCETYSSDLNPVAVIIQKCTLEYPQKYGDKLLEDVEKWGNWVLDEAKKELGKFYPKEPDGSVPVGYIWARTIPCQNPSCRKDIPLMRQFWLARRDKKKIAAYPIATESGVEFKIVRTGHELMPKDFDPKKGTVAKAVAVCPCCGSTVEANTTRKLFQEGKSRQKLVAIITRKEGVIGKRYRKATQLDLDMFNQAQDYLKTKRETLMNEWGIDPVPDEPLPPAGTLGFRIQRYDMNTWGDLFNSRQKLSLIAFVEKVRQSHLNMMKQSYDEEYAKAVGSYLGIILDRLADKASNLARYNNVGEKIEGTFGRQALAMIWDYIEINPFTSTGWPNMKQWVELILDHITKTPMAKLVKVSHVGSPQYVTQSSATAIPYSDNFFDAIFTDPPYYDNVPYSYLSDFFYTWSLLQNFPQS